jgi:hypothetical protein
MKNLTSNSLKHVCGAASWVDQLSHYGQVNVNWDSFSPDVRFDSGKPYQKPFDLGKFLNAICHGESYSYDLLSQNGRYALEIEISLGDVPLRQSSDLQVHYAAAFTS